jgi:hypothetical protein
MTKPKDLLERVEDVILIEETMPPKDYWILLKM